jgi:hypothetical protein
LPYSAGSLRRGALPLGLGIGVSPGYRWTVESRSTHHSVGSEIAGIPFIALPSTISPRVHTLLVACGEPTFSTLDGAVKCVARYGWTRETTLRAYSPSTGSTGPGSWGPCGGRSRRRRTPRRGLWVLLALVLLSCLVVAAIFPWYRERPAETAMLTAVDRPASAEPPEPPCPQHGFAPSKNSTKSSEPSPKRTRVLTGWRFLTSTLERAPRSTPTDAS